MLNVLKKTLTQGQRLQWLELAMAADYESALIRSDSTSETRVGNHPRSAILVAAVLATAYNSNNGWCFPSIRHIARLAHIGEDAVRRGIRQLELAGLITKITRRRKDGSHTSHSFELILGQTSTAGQVKSTGPAVEASSPVSEEGGPTPEEGGAVPGAIPSGIGPQGTLERPMVSRNGIIPVIDRQAAWTQRYPSSASRSSIKDLDAASENTELSISKLVSRYQRLATAPGWRREKAREVVEDTIERVGIESVAELLKKIDGEGCQPANDIIERLNRLGRAVVSPMLRRPVSVQPRRQREIITEHSCGLSAGRIAIIREQNARKPKFVFEEVPLKEEE
ncbi:helix-turn-helix domain-containing protein [Azospirillum picis]|uniref:Helix-turn-helix domain-containing protein n=1 Tax=Azospirillum picis TaxID=488438 RepID=A0ABU0MST5_9PROT|nr:helix-turn-helix domain-containing protein [Azospirillum picis]MBP2302783.1 hypothetical protein [Azospirillum picis]MDQ0536555.1 hypothetical protein [Azospirillum picis]